MEKTKIDLHIHTNCSDGKLTPKEIIDKAKRLGVSTIAIADHDSLDAYTDELFEYAKLQNIKLIPAIEISSKKGKVGVHVLGYNFDIHNKELVNKIQLLRNSRHNYLYQVAEKLENLGYIINLEKLDKIEAVTKAHIALDVIENSHNERVLKENFGSIPSKGEFIETIMNEDCPAYVKKETITPKEASDLIKQAHGKVVLAHPVAYKYEDKLNDEEVIKMAKDIHVDGIEAYYIYIDRQNNVIDDIDKWEKIANNNNWLTTIGSDFHDSDNLHPEIGLTNYNINLSNSQINDILDTII